ncbi:MAG: fructose-bisphosphatase class III [Blastocatellia bacterium]|jgi:fructose-1,6-bisphosphatase-3|nr:fructose-bisphosphatase class III [Blastocatellia bacterium]MBK6428391.1 fructose-bisphosphatase class III [Blastocatellia bacterium]
MAASVPERSVTDSSSIVYLRALALRFPTSQSALAEIAHLRGVLTLPKGTIHIVSDVHGEDRKLKHIINNASGTLRPLVDRVFGDALADSEKLDLLNLIYYPREMLAHLAPRLAGEVDRKAFLRTAVRRLFALVRELAVRYSARDIERVFPESNRLLLRELLLEAGLDREPEYIDAMLDGYVDQGADGELLRTVSHVVRNLLIYELIVAGDLGDRGPRIDRVIDTIMRQPRVAVTWGNHDVTWMAACLGHDPSIATVLRISLRYNRTAQLEEGYGIALAPLEKLAREAYADDPAERFRCRGEGLRDALTMSRMQKAAAILQFKVEGQAVARHPEYGMDDRSLLHRIDPKDGTVEIDGKRWPLRDTHFPTIDWSDPYALSDAEESCLQHLREAFLSSPVLWQQMRFIARNGSTFALRDNNLIFHGCVPVDDAGEFIPMPIGGRQIAGRALFEAIDRAVQRAFRDRDADTLDMMWYLWTGPASPLFGKDRMATFETYLVEDTSTHKETKNPYFKLIHTKAFCDRILSDFGADPDGGLIINGHVPVKIEKGESPVKESGRAVTIDGAFSEAYGDRGYTLVIRAGRIYLAQHHHFESVSDAITTGADIVPTIEEIRSWETLRTVGDTEAGTNIRGEIAVLERLVEAFRDNLLREPE